MTGSNLCIGVGNEYRHDDGVGLEAARRIAARNLPNVRICEHCGEGLGLLQSWEGAECVVIIDAVSSGNHPGTIFRLDAYEQPIPRCFFNYSSHDFSVAEAVELARVMGQLPPKLILYGIEGVNYGMGKGLSLPVQGAVSRILKLVEDDLQVKKYVRQYRWIMG